MSRVIVCDVNETLLDARALEPHFEQAFGDGRVAHAWDIVGALRAGCAAAFVAGPGKVLFPLGPTPDITGPDFRSVATQIVAAESRQA